MLRGLTISVVLACFLASSATAIAEDRPAKQAIWLWAWQRNEDLSFLKPGTAGVAYLAQTLTLAGERVVCSPRMQPLKVPAGTALIAVTRIEISKQDPPALSDVQVKAIVAAIARSATARASELQIDFDARTRERQFYKQLLQESHASLPPGKRLSMTSLASWSLFDSWLADAPVNERVPMFFSMGSSGDHVLQFLQRGQKLLPGFDAAIGVSCDEESVARTVLSSAAAAQRRRTFFFTSKPWNIRSASAAFALANIRHAVQ